VRRHRPPRARDLPASVTCCSRLSPVYGHPVLLVVDPLTSWKPRPSKDVVRRAHATGTRRAEPRVRAPTRRGVHVARHLAVSSAPLRPIYLPIVPHRLASLASRTPSSSAKASGAAATAPLPLNRRARCPPLPIEFPHVRISSCTP
jgi:hypothetical protein